MKMRLSFLILLNLVGMCVASAASQVDISVTPAFLGVRDAAIDTYRADLENHTDKTQVGTIDVDSSGTTYPFSLPPMGRKSVYLYHVFTSSPTWSWTMRCAPTESGPTSEANASEQNAFPAHSQPRVLIITPLDRPVRINGEERNDAMGPQSRLDSSVKFRRTVGPNESIYTCVPDQAPSRGIAYGPFSAVMVTDAGAEQLSPEVAAALEEYALSGGALILGNRVPADNLAAVAQKSGKEEPLGLGTVESLGFDPSTESRKSEGYRAQAVLNQLPASTGMRATDSQFLSPSAPQAIQTQIANDPFAAKFPPFSRVATLLGVYFLAVVPLNYFLLRKFHKPELTWVTAPLLAFAFAGAIFSSTKNLYQSKASSATTGTLFLQEGLPRGLFCGTSDIFLPQAGTLSIPIARAEYIDDRSSRSDTPALSGGSSRANNTDRPDPSPPGLIGAVDNGFVTAPRYEARNLELKKLGVIQSLDAGGWFAFKSGVLKDGFTPISVTNRSGFKIQNAVLHAGDINSAPQELKSGQTITIQTVPTPKIATSVGAVSVARDLVSLVAQDHRILLTGNIEELPVGVNLGTRVAARTNIELGAFARPELRLPYLNVPEDPKVKNHAISNPTR